MGREKYPLQQLHSKKGGGCFFGRLRLQSYTEDTYVSCVELCYGAHTNEAFPLTVMSPPPHTHTTHTHTTHTHTHTHTHTPHLQRFLMPKHVSPAPTTYQDPRTAFESVRKMTGMRRTPFGQTSARFRTDRQAKELPGTYQALVGGVTSFW